ncbi:hypothetical protein ACFL0W_01290 [Nanoarchaeota archaeon]
MGDTDEAGSDLEREVAIEDRLPTKDGIVNHIWYQGDLRVEKGSEAKSGVVDGNNGGALGISPDSGVVYVKYLLTWLDPESSRGCFGAHVDGYKYEKSEVVNGNGGSSADVVSPFVSTRDSQGKPVHLSSGKPFVLEVDSEEKAIGYCRDLLTQKYDFLGS